MVREAIEAYIESLVAHSDPIPRSVEIERVSRRVILRCCNR
jgi:predicted RNase H-like HicB family nuclease